MANHYYKNSKGFFLQIPLPNLSATLNLDAGKYVCGDPADIFGELATLGTLEDTGTGAPTPASLVVFTQSSGSAAGTVSGSLAGSLPSPTIAAGAVGTAELANLGVTNGKLAAGAVTAAKITAGTITNTEINASAAIAFSKLAALADGKVLVGSSGNVATAVTPSGDATVSNAGVVTIAAGAVTPLKVNLLSTAPASAGATGVAGEVVFAAGFIYICTATNTWERVATATW